LSRKEHTLWARAGEDSRGQKTAARLHPAHRSRRHTLWRSTMLVFSRYSPQNTRAAASSVVAFLRRANAPPLRSIWRMDGNADIIARSGAAVGRNINTRNKNGLFSNHRSLSA
jgi:hypothetical protein